MPNFAVNTHRGLLHAAIHCPLIKIAAAAKSSPGSAEQQQINGQKIVLYGLCWGSNFDQRTMDGSKWEASMDQHLPVYLIFPRSHLCQFYLVIDNGLTEKNPKAITINVVFSVFKQINKQCQLTENKYVAFKWGVPGGVYFCLQHCVTSFDPQDEKLVYIASTHSY